VKVAKVESQVPLIHFWGSTPGVSECGAGTGTFTPYTIKSGDMLSWSEYEQNMYM